MQLTTGRPQADIETFCKAEALSKPTKLTRSLLKCSYGRAASRERRKGSRGTFGELYTLFTFRMWTSRCELWENVKMLANAARKYETLAQ